MYQRSYTAPYSWSSVGMAVRIFITFYPKIIDSESSRMSIKDRLILSVKNLNHATKEIINANGPQTEINTLRNTFHLKNLPCHPRQ